MIESPSPAIAIGTTTSLSDRERRRIFARIGVGIAIAAGAAGAFLWYVLGAPSSAAAPLGIAICAAVLLIVWAARCGDSHEHRHLDAQHLALLQAVHELQTAFDAMRIQQQQQLDSICVVVAGALDDLAAKVDDRTRDQKVARARALIADAQRDATEVGEGPKPPFQLYSLGSPTPADGIPIARRSRRHRGPDEET